MRKQRFKSSCTRTMYGNVERDKKAYDNPDDAILDCKKINSQHKQIHKVVAYKCTECNSYHIGKTKKVLSPKYKKKLNRELKYLL